MSDHTKQRSLRTIAPYLCIPVQTSEAEAVFASRVVTNGRWWIQDETRGLHWNLSRYLWTVATPHADAMRKESNDDGVCWFSFAYTTFTFRKCDVLSQVYCLEGLLRGDRALTNFGIPLPNGEPSYACYDNDSVFKNATKSATNVKLTLNKKSSICLSDILTVHRWWRIQPHYMDLYPRGPSKSDCDEYSYYVALARASEIWHATVHHALFNICCSYTFNVRTFIILLPFVPVRNISATLTWFIRPNV